MRTPFPQTSVTSPVNNSYYQAQSAMNIYGTANQYTKNLQGGVKILIARARIFDLWSK